MNQLAHSFGQVRGAGVLGRAVGLSLAIRAVKYLGLAAAFYGVARSLRPALADLPIWTVLIGLISGEGGSALPVPTFLSLGTYEAAGAGAMSLAARRGLAFRRAARRVVMRAVIRAARFQSRAACRSRSFSARLLAAVS